MATEIFTECGRLVARGLGGGDCDTEVFFAERFNHHPISAGIKERTQHLVFEGAGRDWFLRESCRYRTEIDTG